MPTDQRVDQVADIAAILLSEYRQGTPLRDVPQRAAEFDEDTTFVIEVDARGTSLAGLVATLDAVQLAVDAAAVAFYYDLEIPGHAEELNYGLLRNLANERFVSLQILELADGTWRARLGAVFRNKVARAGVISIATLSTTAMGFIFAPVAAIGGGVVGGIASVAAVVDAVQEIRGQRRQDQVNEDLLQQAEAARQQAEDRQREIEELQRRQQVLEDQVRRLLEEKFRDVPPAIDLDAAHEAQIRRFEVTVVPPRAA